jgi:hypothetical protein
VTKRLCHRGFDRSGFDGRRFLRTFARVSLAGHAAIDSIRTANALSSFGFDVFRDTDATITAADRWTENTFARVN